MKTTIDDILISFIKTKQKVFEYEIESELVWFGKNNFGLLHTAGSYSRRWRALRNNPNRLPFNFEKDTNQKNTCWNITNKELQ